MSGSVKLMFFYWLFHTNTNTPVIFPVIADLIVCVKGIVKYILRLFNRKKKGYCTHKCTVLYSVVTTAALLTEKFRMSSLT